MSFDWDHAKKLRKLPAYLRGNAQEENRSLPQVDKLDYTRLVTALRTCLTHAEATRFATAELHSRRQGATESVVHCGSIVKRLARSAFHQTTVDRFSKEAFIQGLHPGIRRIVLFRDPATLGETIREAVKIEAQNRLLCMSESTPVFGINVANAQTSAHGLDD